MTAALSARSSDGLALRVEFAWRGDRYGHVVSIVEADGQSKPLLESIEGTPADSFPPSPPLQSLQVEQLSDDRRAALLVGMAGRNYWSASVEEVAGEATLIFDCACRCSEKPHWLGNQYRRLAEAEGRLKVGSEQAQIDQRENQIRVAPKAIVTPGTVRWRFSLGLITHQPVT